MAESRRRGAPAAVAPGGAADNTARTAQRAAPLTRIYLYISQEILVIRLSSMTPLYLASILLVSSVTSNWAQRTLGPDGPMRPSFGNRATVPAGAALRLETAPTGNEVRYRVRERLVELDMPSDAIGKTGAVTGALTLDSAGKVIPSASRFTVQVGGLTSDRDRRDRYVRERILEADEHPAVELAPNAIRGVTLPLPTSGAQAFELLGNLTVKGVTRPTVWKVDARFSPDGATGTATTAFTFEDFGLAQPRVPVLLSVADTIRLEYAFRLVAAPTATSAGTPAASSPAPSPEDRSMRSGSPPAATSSSRTAS